MQETTEPGVVWQKATMSQALNACVEVASDPDGDAVWIRDSKEPAVVQRYTRQEFACFLDGAKRGEFDHLIAPRQV